MKIVICHSRTKREINGPFNICGSRADLLQLAEAIKEACRSEEESGMVYGWVKVYERLPPEDDLTYELVKEQKPIVNTPPAGWDYDG